MIDPQFAAEFTYSDAEIVAMKERATEELYKAKRSRWKYQRELQLALRERPIVERKPSVPVPQHPPLAPGPAAAAALIGGPIMAAAFIGAVSLVILVLQAILK